jgi:AraC-like DNA-binding protein
MDFQGHSLSSLVPETPRQEGLYRTTIAGPGRSLEEAFARLEASPGVERVLRHSRNDVLCARVALSPQEGEGYWELTRIRQDLYLILSDFKYHAARHEIVPGDGLVQFNFEVSGDMTYEVSLPGPLRFNKPGLHLWRQPLGIDMREWTAARSHQRTVTICVRPQHLADRFLADQGEIPPRLRAFLSEPGSRIDFCELPITSPMLDIIGKLLANPYGGSLYLVYQEALVQQLLCAALAHCASTEGAQSTYADRTVRAVQRARRILGDPVSAPPGVAQLARIVGLSRRVLVEVFRSVYGETPADVRLRCRMDHAMTLLRDQGRSVDEVSARVGYAHPTSFATAFRRHFGVRPIDIKPRRTARARLRRNRIPTA